MLHRPRRCPTASAPVGVSGGPTTDAATAMRSGARCRDARESSRATGARPGLRHRPARSRACACASGVPVRALKVRPQPSGGRQRNRCWPVSSKPCLTTPTAPQCGHRREAVRSTTFSRSTLPTPGSPRSPAPTVQSARIVRPSSNAGSPIQPLPMTSRLCPSSHDGHILAELEQNRNRDYALTPCFLWRHDVIHSQVELRLKLTPGNVHDTTPVPALTRELTGKLFGDKGYIGQKLAEDLLRRGLTLFTRVRKNMKSLPISLQDKALLNARNMADIGHIKEFSSLNLSKHRSWAASCS